MDYPLREVDKWVTHYKSAINVGQPIRLTNIYILFELIKKTSK